MERLDAWWLETAKLAWSNPQDFIGQVPRMKREAAQNATGDASDLVRTRMHALRMCEGIVDLCKFRNEAAELVFKEARQLLEQLLPQVSTPGLTRLARKLIGFCHINLGNVALNRSDYAEALRMFLHAREIALTAGIPQLLGPAVGNIGAIYGDVGVWEKQVEYATEARRICEETKNEISAVHADINIARAYRKMRDFTAARQSSDRGLEIAQRNGWKGEKLHALVELAMTDLAENNAVAAEHRLRAAQPLSIAADRPYLEACRRTELGRVQLAMGQLAPAAATLLSVIDAFSDEINSIELADARIVLSRVRLAEGNCAEAAAQASEALQLLGRSGLPNELEVEGHALLADAARARGDWESACREERARHEAYVRHFNHQADLRTRVLGVEHQIDIARAAAERERVERQRLEELLADLAARLQEADARPRARSAEEIKPDDLRPLGLTARESEILLWVARGKTNDEIAIILGCGAETVKSHLKHIYLQLDVTNRAAAAAAALQPVPSAAKLTHANTKSAMRS